jgi:hypothetical protein
MEYLINIPAGVGGGQDIQPREADNCRSYEPLFTACFSKKKKGVRIDSYPPFFHHSRQVGYAIIGAERLEPIQNGLSLAALVRDLVSSPGD